MNKSLILVTLNEIKGLQLIMPRIKREWVDEIFFLDGRSTDGTIDYIKSNDYTLILEEHPGYGARKALTEALSKIKGDVIITFSPDGNCIPELIPKLIQKMEEGYDMVIASRYAKGAKSYDDNLITGFGNWMFTKLISILFGYKYTDVMNIYRAFRKDIIYDLELDKYSSYSTPEKLFKTKIGWEPLFSIRAAKRKLKIAEIPGDEPARIGGKSKLKVIRWGAAYMFQVIREIFVWR